MREAGQRLKGMYHKGGDPYASKVRVKAVADLELTGELLLAAELHH
jgi:hypothetical protein